MFAPVRHQGVLSQRSLPCARSQKVLAVSCLRPIFWELRSERLTGPGFLFPGRRFLICTTSVISGNSLVRFFLFVPAHLPCLTVVDRTGAKAVNKEPCLVAKDHSRRNLTVGAWTVADPTPPFHLCSWTLSLDLLRGISSSDGDVLLIQTFARSGRDEHVVVRRIDGFCSFLGGRRRRLRLRDEAWGRPSGVFGTVGRGARG